MKPKKSKSKSAGKSERDPYETEGAWWQRYIEKRYGIALHRQAAQIALNRLICTQAEIETIKYELVRLEGFRADHPIAVYRGSLNKAFIVDGHTRARVALDSGETSIDAVLMTSHDPSVDLELADAALRVGGGRELTLRSIPIRDRLGRGTPAWKRRRRELLQKNR